jgi:hypothetical protein
VKKELVALYLGLSTAICAQQKATSFLIRKLDAEAKGWIPECENLPLTTSAQSTETRQQTKRASPSAKITKFCIDQPERSSYETGPLHIIYSDGTEVVQTLPPLRATTDKETVFNAVGFSGVELAQDQQTLGWTVNVENCCTSYSIPLSVVLFRDRRVLHTIDQGQMVWSWMFVQGGKQVAVAFGPTHGPEVGDYRLYDVQTGKLVSGVWADEDTQALKADAPHWARQLQDHFHSR